MASCVQPKRLIVTADDFGLTQSVNAAIVLAHREGVVTSASIMANGLAFESAASLAKSNPELDVGLHLNLTEGSPASHPSDVPTLATSHEFRYNNPLHLALAVTRGKVRLSDMEREIRSQLERALDAGLRISHIDGHKHVHGIPAVLRILDRILPEYGIKAIRQLVERAPRLRRLLFRNYRAGSQVIEQYLTARMIAAVWRKPAMKSPDYFYGFTQTGFLDLDAFTNIVHDLKGGVNELMSHPGYVDDELRQTPTRLRSQRERELELLTSSEVRNLITRSGVELISYRQLLGDYGDCATN
jgi:hopanoid biosynthesis associated protein HpnK